jgi:uncharacterized protein YgfB (UPF0149 family)
VDYQQFASGLTAMNTSYRPAEWHGLLCGLACAGRQVGAAGWFKSAMLMTGNDGTLTPAVENTLQAVCDSVAAQLQGTLLEFELMLPDEDDELQHRAEALREWCGAFLYGLALGGMQQDTELSAEAGDFLRDLAEFCQVYHDQSTTTESDEFYFMELEEYVRAGVTLLHDELNAGLPAEQPESLH